MKCSLGSVDTLAVVLVRSFDTTEVDCETFPPLDRVLNQEESVVVVDIADRRPLRLRQYSSGTLLLFVSSLALAHLAYSPPLLHPS